ncbi:MAG TPA: DUF2911 domain-containing protein [Terriglobales bacterium]|nr:DUF2911 domain-containing protein [Terriglobales bacterium]
MRKFAVVGYLGVFVLIAMLVYAQQDKSKRPSPPGSATVTFSTGKKITIDYSRPKVADPKTGATRKIFGGVVPYGQVWRTGANEATTFVTDGDVMVNDLHVPAGKYTMFSIPGENEWTIVISKATGEWGTQYDEKQDLGRTKVKAGKTSSAVPQFTITLNKTGDKKADMVFEWESTKVTTPITAH